VYLRRYKGIRVVRQKKKFNKAKHQKRMDGWMDGGNGLGRTQENFGGTIPTSSDVISQHRVGNGTAFLWGVQRTSLNRGERK